MRFPNWIDARLIESSISSMRDLHRQVSCKANAVLRMVNDRSRVERLDIEPMQTECPSAGINAQSRKRMGFPKNPCGINW